MSTLSVLRVLGALALVLTLVLSLPVDAAAVPDPASPPRVNAAYVYVALKEAGDVGVLVEYYLDYVALPTETVTEAYIVAFLDTDGVTQLKSVAPYSFSYGAFNNKGYRRALAWIYFSASEVTTYSLSSASFALYRIRLMGNPTVPSGWAGNPPAITAGLTDWQSSGSAATLLARRILDYASLFETNWSLDLVDATSVGSRLTVAGESYFVNAITDVRTMAPSAFSSGIERPTREDLDYSTTFGATMTNGTGTVVGSPITLTAGANTVNVTGAGTFVLTLLRGTTGTVVNATGIVTGSPVALVMGTNTVTVPVGGTGNLTVTVNLTSTQATITGGITGTGWDTSAAANVFGLSRSVYSGLVWLGALVLVCAAAYKQIGGKHTLLLFNLGVVGGAALGLMPLLVAALLFIGSGAVIGYTLFYRGANY